MTPEKRREVSRLGGKAIPSEKRSFSRDRELAREAGRKGGLTPKRSKHKLTVEESGQLVGSLANSNDAA